MANEGASVVRGIAGLQVWGPAARYAQGRGGLVGYFKSVSNSL